MQSFGKFLTSRLWLDGIAANVSQLQEVAKFVTEIFRLR